MKQIARLLLVLSLIFLVMSIVEWAPVKAQNEVTLSDSRSINLEGYTRIMGLVRDQDEVCYFLVDLIETNGHLMGQSDSYLLWGDNPIQTGSSIPVVDSVLYTLAIQGADYGDDIDWHNPIQFMVGDCMFVSLSIATQAAVTEVEPELTLLAELGDYKAYLSGTGQVYISYQQEEAVALPDQIVGIITGELVQEGNYTFLRVSATNGCYQFGLTKLPNFNAEIWTQVICPS